MDARLSTVKILNEKQRSPEHLGLNEALSERRATAMIWAPLGGAPGRREPAMSVWPPIRLLAVVLALAALMLFCSLQLGVADSFEDSPPSWEPLLWGGPITQSRPRVTAPRGKEREETPAAFSQEQRETGSPAGELLDLEKASRLVIPEFSTPGSLLSLPPIAFEAPEVYQRMPYRALSLKNIAPLYTSPVLPGEGVWDWKGMPTAEDGWPTLYRTSYRPSIEYPNAIVHMLLFDMKHLSMKLYVGSSEPGGSERTAKIEPDARGRLVAITNALWKLRHSGNAGSVHQGMVIRDLVPGVATLVVYKDGSVDILEWSTTIPVSLVSDAKQLRHLIVKDGKVVHSIIQGGREADSEIGLGYLLAEEQPGAQPGFWGGYWNPGPVHTSGADWFIATRSAFGVRPDGNLVFAAGYHISTKDLAKALVLAGCVRAIHADANPFNVLGNLYFVDQVGNLYKKAKLAPEQNGHSLNRYVGNSYTSDFFAFFIKRLGEGSS